MPANQHLVEAVLMIFKMLGFAIALGIFLTLCIGCCATVVYACSCCCSCFAISPAPGLVAGAGAGADDIDLESQTPGVWRRESRQALELEREGEEDGEYISMPPPAYFADDPPPDYEW